MVSSSASPSREEWDNVIAFTGSASLEKAGPLVGSVDVAESMDEYLFRVSLPGVTRDEKVISCEVRPDWRILIKGESATGENTVCKHSMVFKMQTQNLCLPGEFTVSIQLPVDGWEKPNLEDQEQFSVDSGTFLPLLALFASCFSSFVYPFPLMEMSSPILSIILREWTTSIKFHFANIYATSPPPDRTESFFSSTPLDQALSLVGPLLGSVDFAESKDDYLFRVSLPGVTRDESFCHDPNWGLGHDEHSRTRRPGTPSVYLVLSPTGDIESAIDLAGKPPTRVCHKGWSS
ncbi:Alpha-crystallin domain-containing protein 22.3 [Capsicum annuum]|nr:Alpha-crystallin domain-containing protein 22.3 [Capsicum annuum]